MRDGSSGRRRVIRQLATRTRAGHRSLARIAHLGTIDSVSTARTPAIDLVRRAGVAFAVHEYRPAERHGRDRDARPDYGLEAAAALGLPAGRVFKTLIANVDGRPVAAVLPVDRQLDPRRLAAALGGRRAELAEPRDAERVAGSAIGGISPLGTRRPLTIVLDASAGDHATIHVSAGRRGLQLELAPDDLVRLGNAIVASVSRTGGDPP
jgi:Cys-tRNA(Pro)/Cys-tRNA(Cys) deacylase